VAASCKHSSTSPSPDAQALGSIPLPGSVSCQLRLAALVPLTAIPACVPFLPARKPIPSMAIAQRARGLHSGVRVLPPGTPLQMHFQFQMFRFFNFSQPLQGWRADRHCGQAFSTSGHLAGHKHVYNVAGTESYVPRITRHRIRMEGACKRLVALVKEYTPICHRRLAWQQHVHS